MFRIVVIIGGQPLRGVWFDSKNWTIEEVQHLQENVLKNYSYYLEYKNQNPFQTKQGSRPSCPDQEWRKGSEEGVPENLGVPLEGDRDFGCRGQLSTDAFPGRWLQNA